MTDIPIIFSGPMVRALWDGRKTKTRRLLYSLRKAKGGIVPAGATMLEGHPPGNRQLSPQGFPTDHGPDQYFTLTGWHKVKPGDRLWVRESLQKFDREPPTVQHVATLTGVVAPPGIERHPNGAALWKWRKRTIPSIHMPRWASRLTLEVTGAKIERLASISDADAIAEGVERKTCDLISVRFPAWFGDPAIASDTPAMAFAALWEMLHGPGSWDDNPWVVALSLTVHKTNIDAMPKADAA